MPNPGSRAAAPLARPGSAGKTGLLVACFCLHAFGCAEATVGDVGTKVDAGGGDAEAKNDASGDAKTGKDGPASDVSYGVCDPFTNSGCGSGEKCTALQQSSGQLSLGCDGKSTKAAGEACTQVTGSTGQIGDDCNGGLACFSTQTGASATCHRFCPTSGTANACPSGEACSLLVSGLTGLAFCQVSASCLPLEQTGCPSDRACYMDATGALCAPKGSKLPGESCQASNDCEPGSTCLVVGSTGTCSSFCSTASGGSPGCSGSGTGGNTCAPLGGPSDEPNLGSCRQQP